jgi:hypothetical protein
MLTVSKSTCQSIIRNPSDSIKIPVSLRTMKLMIRDLELGKSYKKQLGITNQNIGLLENKVKIKDNIISSLNQKEVNYKSIIQNKDQILIEKNTIIVGMSQEKTNLQLKLFRSRLTTVVLVPLAAGITYLLLK